MELAETGYLEEKNVKLLGTNTLAIKKAEDREAVSACKVIYGQVKNSAFKPLCAELDFGFDNSKLPPVKIVADGHEILLNGKIDRIDACGDKFVIVDYKTGKASFDDNELFAGKKLQLLTYVKACLQFLQKQCVGFFYMPINDTFASATNSLVSSENIGRYVHCDGMADYCSFLC